MSATPGTLTVMTISDAALTAPALDALRDVFGYDAFRGDQKEIIEMVA